MINTKELRIGNIVEITIINPEGKTLRGTGRIGQLQQDHVRIGDGILAPVTMLRPIPLTPEVLEKCGFIDPAKNGWGYRMPISSKDELCWYMQDGFIRLQTQGSGFTRRMDHVTQLHQLQNLFFALTGEELKLNL